MREYLIRRILLVIPTLLIISIILFVTVRMVPGGIVDIMVQRMAFRGGETIDRAAIERILGLDAPVYVQYGRWLGVLKTPVPVTGSSGTYTGDIEPRYSGLLQGSLGEDMWTRQPVLKAITARLPVTFELGLIAMVIGLVIALPVGVYSAIRQDTAADYAGRAIAVIGLSLPNFWLAVMVMIFPAIWWGWSPPVQLIPFSEDPLGNLGQFLIPGVILGTGMSAMTMRMTRTMMLEELRQDYIRTAWSKGLKERVVVVRHAIKNALIPIVTLVGYQIPLLVGGAVIMEQIFALPGMGRLMVDSLNTRNYSVVSGVNLVVAATIVVANLLVDMSYALLDPRIRYR